jgi:16S rRNA (uracil1498-N3)-methyltransferase
VTRRAYSSQSVAAAAVEIDGPEAHHLLHVLRVAAGDAVTLFDGSGAEFDAVVAACRRATVELAILARREASREPAEPVTLAVPLPKGERTRWIVEKAVELGVARLVPLRTRHSAAEGRGHEKLDRYVIEASKQCGRNRLMEIADPVDWSEWLATVDPSAASGVRRWIADPGAAPFATEELSAGGPVYAAVGPEGGLTAEELKQAQDAGWRLVGLGPRILRIETAALALAVLATQSTR